jgi:MraZ protein
VFEGASSLSVDAKGRIAIPTKYRADLMDAAQGQLHITRHFQEDCLLLFPESEWVQFRTRVAQWPASAAWQKRIVLGNAVALDMDGATGRILLSPELREAAMMGREALLLGNGSHFELWDKALYAAKEAQARQQPLPDALQDFVF